MRTYKYFPRILGLVAVAALMFLIPSAAQAGSGGTSVGGSGDGKTVKGNKAKLRKGKAIPPENAPKRVVRVIKLANKIRNKPYRYGGGHSGFGNDSGYDCSGAVSYALGNAGLLRRPLDSSGFSRWKKGGKGDWISVYGAPSHAYMVVAGLRFDTAMTKGDGVSWSRSLRSTPENYKVRHHPKF